LAKPAHADGKAIIDDPTLADVVVKGLGAKGAWLAGQIAAIGASR
jgi:hypothetical protein